MKSHERSAHRWQGNSTMYSKSWAAAEGTVNGVPPCRSNQIWSSMASDCWKYVNDSGCGHTNEWELTSETTGGTGSDGCKGVNSALYVGEDKWAFRQCLLCVEVARKKRTGKRCPRSSAVSETVRTWIARADPLFPRGDSPPRGATAPAMMG